MTLDDSELSALRNSRTRDGRVSPRRGEYKRGNIGSSLGAGEGLKKHKGEKRTGKGGKGHRFSGKEGWAVLGGGVVIGLRPKGGG